MTANSVEPTASAYGFPLLIKRLLEAGLSRAPDQEIVYADTLRLSYRLGRRAGGHRAGALQRRRRLPSDHADVSREQAWAPSAVALELGKHSKLFAAPKAMDEAQIAETITRFADTATAAERAGFTGVEIHAAHGYLMLARTRRLTLRCRQWRARSLAVR